MDENIMLGACRYCGQTYQIRDAKTQQAADEQATMICQCDDALQNKRILDVIREAKEKADDLLGEIGEQDGFVPVENEQVRELIYAAIRLVAIRELKETTMQILGRGVVKIKASGIGGVKIERSRTLKRSEETV